LSEDEWRDEWDNVLKLASSQPRTTSAASTPGVGDADAAEGASAAGAGAGSASASTYESLEEIHVLALAHVLKRPIIVIADTVLKVDPLVSRLPIHRRHVSLVMEGGDSFLVCLF